MLFYRDIMYSFCNQKINNHKSITECKIRILISAPKNSFHCRQTLAGTAPTSGQHCLLRRALREAGRWS